ncbi:hypothetical protein LLB_2282 [Legionella longbeachae D-4968]|nr:hypothetical protein LLB_2282 [Legionella longbeachae D-4968]
MPIKRFFSLIALMRKGKMQRESIEDRFILSTAFLDIYWGI